MSSNKYYFDPEYCGEVSLKVIKNQFKWFFYNTKKYKSLDKESFNEFLKDNFVVCSSRAELEKLISSGGFSMHRENKNLIHYKGEIGEFDYDPSIWEIVRGHLKFRNEEVKSLPKGLKLPKGCIDTSHMFEYRQDLVDISPLQNWDTSNVVSMENMFSKCISLIDISPLQNWDTSNVRDMSHMFEGCISLKDISILQNWSTSKVKDMTYMFCNCKNLIDISPLQGWDTSKVECMSSMLSYCQNLKDISPLQNWDTSKVKDMFRECENLTGLYL